MKLLSLNCADCRFTSALYNFCLVLMSAIAACFCGSFFAAFFLLVTFNAESFQSAVHFAQLIGFSSMVGVFPLAVLIVYPLLVLGVKIPKTYRTSILISAISGGFIGAIVFLISDIFGLTLRFSDSLACLLYFVSAFYFGGWFGFCIKYIHNN